MNLVRNIDFSEAPPCKTWGVFDEANYHKTAYYSNKFKVFTDGTGYCYAFKSSFRLTWVVIECSIEPENIPNLFETLKKDCGTMIYVDELFKDLFNTDFIEAKIDMFANPPTLHYLQDYFNLAFCMPNQPSFNIGLKLLK